MSRNELRKLALDLRKQNPEFQALHSQVTQQLLRDSTKLGSASSKDLRTSPRKRSRTGTFLWCTLRVAESFLIQEKLVLEKQKEEESST